MNECMKFVNISLHVTFYTPLHFLYTRYVPWPLSTWFKSKHVTECHR